MKTIKHLLLIRYAIYLLVVMIAISLLVGVIQPQIESLMHGSGHMEEQLAGTWRMSDNPLIVLSLNRGGKWKLYISNNNSAEGLREVDSGTWIIRNKELKVFSSAESLVPMFRDKYITDRVGYMILGVSQDTVSTKRLGDTYVWHRVMSSHLDQHELSGR